MVVPGGWVVPTSVMFPQVYFTHPCSAVGRSVNGRPKPTMPFVPLVPIYLPTNRLPAASLAYSGDADEFRFEPGGVLPRAARPRFGDFVGQRRAGNGGAVLPVPQ